MRSLVSAILVTISLSGCASVVTDVNKFGALPGGGKTFIPHSPDRYVEGCIEAMILI